MPTTQTGHPYTEAAPGSADRDHAMRTAPRHPFTRRELAFMIGVPLLWAILLLFHPGGDGKEMYLDLHDQVTPTLVVHVGMLLFIPLMGIVVLVLLRGLDSPAARISRIALAVFVVFYSAWEALQGIGNGILVDQANGLPETERATGATLVQDFAENILIREGGVLGSIGGIGLITAAIAAGVALRRAGAALSVAVLLGLAGFLIAAHPPPFGPTGLAMFIVAILVLVRRAPSLREESR